MTHDIMASALDTNNKTVTVENIRVADGTFVESNTELCTISTPKASEVILSSCSGFVVILAREGEELPGQGRAALGGAEAGADGATPQEN